MAITNCKACGKEVAVDANKCPHCGVSNPGVKASHIFWFVAMVLFVAFAFVQCTSSSTDTEKDESAAAPVNSDWIEQPLSNDQAAEALSAFVGEAQAKFLALGLTNTFLLSKLQQDIQWGDLDKYREDATAMKNAAMEVQEGVSTIAYPSNLTEEQAAQFEAVSIAIDDLAAAFVLIGVDVSVNAHTGMEIEAELKKDAKALESARTGFAKTVMAAYMALDYPADRIDADTLQLKAPSIK